MTEFCGWEMPVLYKDLGVIAEHNGCRNNAAVFDVSHMGQVQITGPDREKFIQAVTPVSLSDVGLAKLSVLLTPEGGMIDDTLITKWDDSIGMVVNAGNIEKDTDHMKQYAKEIQANVDIQYLPHLGLLALQGPNAMKILQGLVGSEVDLTKMAFMRSAPMTVNGLQCGVTRCGYTGEDGFEISVPVEKAEELATVLLEKGATLAGLGARDSLRLEAGLCLYGVDMDERISPIEAGLTFVIAKKRREEGGFLGAERVQKDLKGCSKKRVGFILDGKAPARAGVKIFTEDGQTEIGEVTSGCPSPTLGKPIGVGYINTPVPKSGTTIGLMVRNKLQTAKIAKMPFVPSNYFRVKA
eukprot:TRINITY_DN67023_c7_g1_i10.p1 TRINITY_DN67023_c7_g1~~TRINITY_DN67023_c7_g1_i10.p1  ORF type:complete len:395 (-),score=39.95 TRINITY_DN67023_c7_g1_i10:119-1180(-)